MANSPDGAERRIPAAACDRAIPATQCLAWHVQGRVPGAVLGNGGLSCRLRCPRHDDHKPSLVISIGDHAPLMWHCHKCGKDARLEIRYALIDVYKINSKCLPMTRKERAEQEEMVFAVFASSYAASTKLVCIRAIHEGMRGPLPPAPPLVDLGSRASVSRRSAFRARDELAGASLDHLFVSEANRTRQAPQVTAALCESLPVPDWHSAPIWHSRSAAPVPIWHWTTAENHKSNRRPAA